MKLDPAGIPFVVALLVLAVAAALWSPWLALVPAALLAFTVNFFRDPERVVPDDAAAILAPACGKIIRADAARVSIFMNVFDVHVCRAPIAGRVVSVERCAGRFLSAFREEASDANERTTIVVSADPREPVRFTLVAGLVARRIVSRVAPGRDLAAGERVGIIRFGSRVDVDLPRDAAPVVRVGDRVVSGETVLARRAPRPA